MAGKTDGVRKTDRIGKKTALRLYTCETLPEETEACSALLLYGPDRPDGKHGSNRPRRGYRSHGPDGKHGSNWLYGAHRRNRPGRIGSGCGISYRVFSAGSSGNVRDSAGF